MKKAVDPYNSFRKKLVLFAIVIVSVIAIPALLIAVQRPWKELQRSIEVSNGIIGSVQEAYSPNDLHKMNEFAIARIAETKSITEEERTYLDWTFNMYLVNGTLLSEQEIKNTLTDNKIQLQTPLQYEKVQRAFTYWDAIFKKQPDMLQLFRKYKTYLIKVKKHTSATGLTFSDVYVMLDTGKRAGFFTNNIAFVLDGYPWYLSSFPGDKYETSAGSSLRTNALTGRTGFSHNNIVDPNNWFLPAFYTDQWGRWFSVWSTTYSNFVYNSFILDFDAGIVLERMKDIALTSLGIGIVGFIVISWIIHKLSSRYSRSPVELSKGITHVSKGNYEYEVPPLYDEFELVRNQFNDMIKKLQERDRLQTVLEKFLSKELADKAAKEGLLIGGSEAMCTIMFTDFAGFSSITHMLEPEEIVTALNEYFSELVPIIKKHGGFPDKYIGDAIVAIFGAPLHTDDHAERAVACAIEMQKKMQQVNKKRREQKKSVFEMRIGLNTGKVLVGAIGCDMKLEYTSIGETTNLAQRMEANCTIGNILVSHKTYTALHKNFLKKQNIPVEQSHIVVKGYKDPVETYHMYVAAYTIEKNADPTSSEDFYSYKQISAKKMPATR